MENLRRELEVLRAIDNTPMPPQGIPGVFTDKTGMVKMSPHVVNYLKAIGEYPKTDNDSKIHFETYLEILKKHNISTIGHSVIRFVVLEPNT